MRLEYSFKYRRFEFHCEYWEKDIPKQSGFFWDKMRKIWWTNKLDRALNLKRFAKDKSIFDIKVLVFNENLKRFEFFCHFEHKNVAKNAGFTFDYTNKIWFSTNSDHADILKKYAKNPNIIEKGRKAIAETRKESLKDSYACTSDIEVPSPEEFEYYPFQKAGINFICKHKNTLIADEMGLGKTIQSIGYINCYPDIKKILVICPAFLKLNWNKELIQWLTNKDLKIDLIVPKKIRYKKNKEKGIKEKIVEKQKITDPNIVIINYDLLLQHKYLNQVKWDLLIIDEAHYVSNYKSNRTKATQEIAKKAKARIALTGTPMLNRPIELFSILNMLQAPIASDFWEYAYEFCDAKENHFGWDFTGASNLEDLNRKLRATIMIRRLKKDVLEELPSKIRQIIPLNFDRANRKLKSLLKQEENLIHDYRFQVKEIEQLVKQKKDNKEEYNLAVQKLNDFNITNIEIINTLRKNTALLKLPLVLKYLTHILKEKNKIVVFAYHRVIVDGIAEHFGESAVKLYGGMSDSDRNQSIENFQKNPDIRVFVGSIRASEGFTLTASSTCLFVEFDWTPSKMQQAEDRLHRIGQKNAVLIQYLVIDETIDCMLAKKIQKKQELIDKILNDNIETEQLYENIKLKELFN